MNGIYLSELDSTEQTNLAARIANEFASNLDGVTADDITVTFEQGSIIINVAIDVAGDEASNSQLIIQTITYAGETTTNDAVLNSVNITTSTTPGLLSVDTGASGSVTVNEDTQDFVFNSGYTWFSTYLKMTQSITNKLTNPLSGMELHDSSSNVITFNGSAWSQPDYILSNKQLYKMFIPNDLSYNISITAPHESFVNITLNPGWNWISYPSISTRTVNNVFANPTNGDYIVGQNGASFYITGFAGLTTGWTDPNFSLTRGKGFKYYSASTATQTITIYYLE